MPDHQGLWRQGAALLLSVYNQPDPVSDLTLYRRAVKASADLPVRRDGSAASDGAGGAGGIETTGGMLGPLTTRLEVETTVQMQPLPTGIYHLLDEATDPLLSVRVKNKSDDAKRVCIRAWLEGLSARAVGTVELARDGEHEFKFLPTLLPHRARTVT